MARRPSVGEAMSNPAYLAESYRLRKDAELRQELQKKAMGVRAPERPAGMPEHLGFAEGAFSADQGKKPQMPVTNPKFNRRK